MQWQCGSALLNIRNLYCNIHAQRYEIRDNIRVRIVGKESEEAHSQLLGRDIFELQRRIKCQFRVQVLFFELGVQVHDNKPSHINVEEYNEGLDE